jgi:hypothetical protein
VNNHGAATKDAYFAREGFTIDEVAEWYMMDEAERIVRQRVG